VKRSFAAAALALAASLTGACHQGYAYHQVHVDLPVAGTDSVAIGTLDQREAVIRQGRGPEFVGVLQESAGTTLTVTTESGAPLASDISKVIQRSLDSSGFAAEPLELSSNLTQQQAFERLRSTGRKHLVLLVVRRWESETDKNTELYFDLSLSVYNAPGALKGQSEAHGTDQFAASGSSSFDEVESVLTDALGRKLSMLFSEQKIQEAFRRTN
jgi:hypothetical protein